MRRSFFVLTVLSMFIFGLSSCKCTKEVQEDTVIEEKVEEVPEAPVAPTPTPTNPEAPKPPATDDAAAAPAAPAAEGKAEETK